MFIPKDIESLYGQTHFKDYLNLCVCGRGELIKIPLKLNVYKESLDNISKSVQISLINRVLPKYLIK